MRYLTDFFLGNTNTVTIKKLPSDKRHELLAGNNVPYQFPKDAPELKFPVEEHHPALFVDTNDQPLVFDINNEAHVNYLRECNQLFKDTFKRLKQMDSTNTVLCVSYLLTIIPQLIVVNRPFSGHVMKSILAQKFTNEAVNYTDEMIAMGVIYYQGQRTALYKEYREIFLRQIHNMVWATGYWEAGAEPEVLKTIQTHPVINELVLTMSEVLTIEEIKAIISDSIEDLFLQNANNLHQQLYSGRRQAVNLSLYGTQSDSFMNYIKAPALYMLDKGADAVSFVQSFR